MSKSKPMTKLQKTINLLSRIPADTPRKTKVLQIAKMAGFEIDKKTGYSAGGSTYLQLAQKAIEAGRKATPTRVRKAKAA